MTTRSSTERVEDRRHFHWSLGAAALGSILAPRLHPSLPSLAVAGDLPDDSPTPSPLRIEWESKFLSIRGEFPGEEIRINYLEAYCRPGSTDRDWRETVIPHQSQRIAGGIDGKVIKLEDHLQDGVIVMHTITAGIDEIDFQVVAHNPMAQPSLAHWAQPCMRVDKFTGCATQDARTLVPQYARQCFILLDGSLTRLPTTPWAEKARYTPGQVYCPAHVDRDDVNPRPLSKLVPSHSLCGCFSSDNRKILAVAWEPYQEIFQGVISCLHSDFRIGGLKPQETKVIRGKLYVVDADVNRLLKRYAQDFPEQKVDSQKVAP
ncbi:MAG: hypothetical protein FJ295_19015 [Planctomycetes bacterium]|nr:hypothetical protein [Planctomycetota bacterium]